MTEFFAYIEAMPGWSFFIACVLTVVFIADLIKD